MKEKCKYLKNRFGYDQCTGQKGAPQCYCNGDEEKCECDDCTLTEDNENKTQSYEDAVNHPYHYTYGSIEVIDAILDWKLDFCLSNAIKYIARCEHKNNKIEDLKKAIWYINKEIEQMEKE